MLHHQASQLPKIVRLGIGCLLCIVFNHGAFSQAEVEAWGNLKGIRIDGELMKIESSIDVVNSDWLNSTQTARERQRPKYKREGKLQTVTTKIDSFYFIQQVEDSGKGIATVHIGFTAKKDSSMAGMFFHLKLPVEDYDKGTLQLLSPQQKQVTTYQLAAQKDLAFKATALRFTTAHRQLEIFFNRQVNLVLKRSSGKDKSYIDLFIPLQQGNTKIGDTGEQVFTLKASGTIDQLPAVVLLNTVAAAPVFAGFGGNFRLQNPKTDPQVIDYCLENLRVAWGRVEMPWQLWQPVKDSNAIEAAKAGRLNEHVKKSMEMAQRLYKMGMPVILTAWSAPKWAITGNISYGPRANGVWGNPLDTTQTQNIYQSITDYIIYLRDVYGVSIKLFSFNESDLGINIRQTGEEHATLIKGLGAYFAAHGLKTKMLLGDNSDATTYTFIDPAMKDTAARRYIGAISFHSWRGWDTATLQKWRDAATALNLPLVVGEGSIDAAAWNYPLIFEEPIYAMEEINLYIRLLAICQPVSILQWQLTADYSPLSGGGIFGNNEPLRPTQRFWNLKQLASVPENIAAIPVTINRPFITVAAQGNPNTGKYAIHLVNNGATRNVTIKGLPKTLHRLHLFITNKEQHMQEGKTVAVTNGQATLQLMQVSYTTLVSN